MQEAIAMFLNWLFPPVLHAEKVVEKYEPGNYFGS